MIPQKELHAALKTAKAFIDPSLPGLHVAHFNFITPAHFEVVATDGHRLVTIEFSAPHSCPEGTRVSVPLPMIEELLDMFPAEDGPEITLAFWEGKLLFTNGTKTHMVRGPVAGEYPDYGSLIGPGNYSAAGIYLNPKLLIKILKDCAPLSASKTLDGPTMILSPVDANTDHELEKMLRFKFKINPEIEVISALTAYLVPLTDVTL